MKFWTWFIFWSPKKNFAGIGAGLVLRLRRGGNYPAGPIIGTKLSSSF
jgi:hypothetical protein